MEAINYIAGEKNMILTEDAQIVQGVSGNGCYLPAGTGKIALKGDRNELSVSLWRQWDGVVEQDAKRGIFSFTNIAVFFDNKTDLLTVIINGFKAITDIKDEQKQAHWCFTFAKNGRFIIYKDAKEVYSLIAGNKPVDMTDGFTLGGGKTHATFDEVRVYKVILTQGEVNGLFYLVSKGTQVKQLENIVQSATPKYLGVTETVPATRTAIITKGERLGAQDANPGDWVLMSKTVGGWKCGVCYRWTGTLWINLEPEANYVEQYHACLLHICEIPELMKNTGHFGALFAKVIVAQEAFIKKLAADQAFLKELIVQRLRIDSDKNSDTDFEAWFDKDNGLKIKNKGEEIFKVDIAGNICAQKAVFTDCIFSGDIYSGPLELSSTAPKSTKIVFYSGTSIKDIAETRGTFDIECSSESPHSKIVRVTLIQNYYVKGEPGKKYYYNSKGQIYDWEHITVQISYKRYVFSVISTDAVENYFFIKGQWFFPQNITVRLNDDRNDIIPYNIIIYSKQNSKTLKLKNLPTLPPEEKGLIWVSSDGVLHIS